MKKCNKCLEIKDDSEFYVNSRNKNRTDNICKQCIAAKNKKYRDLNKETIKKLKKEWYEENKEKVSLYQQNYYKENTEYIRDRINAYCENNKEKVAEGHRQWRINNKVKVNEYHKQYMADKLNNDIQFKIKQSLRHRVYSALNNQNIKKELRTFELVNCTYKQFNKYLESLFLNSMSWDNYGQWHIDHIIPCDSFDLTNEQEQKKCFHYTNLMPLWVKDNLEKSNYEFKTKIEAIDWLEQRGYKLPLKFTYLD